ncbi:MAG: hypothetical protein GWM88_08235 [Pseudomonadales bacterium]|nr:hypothetical protein [Pseudomonadales bacterium]NIX07991.1 hypothetical protein [Pseudomonadales bacterium]
MSSPSRIAKFTCSIVATAALYASSGLALPPETRHDRHGEADFEGLLKAPVSSIPAADRIEGWARVDDTRVVLELAPRTRYLLTLRQECFGLGFARNVSVTMSNNTIYAGFDAINADGEQCEIRTINPLLTP